MIITRYHAYQLWIDALRSGKYKQTTDQLKTNLKPRNSRPSWGYCCLGLVCEVAIKPYNTENLKWKHDANGLVEQGQRFDGDVFNLSKNILSFLGMTVKDHENLVALNDDDKLEFDEIADYIEDILMPKAIARPAIYTVRNYKL